ncbi:MAG: glutamine--fructose-6-phosphate transaminase (isomerizing) [Candidatus Omnitrophica bacterium]|nr:glutamine--fructose-6-phosphate transaminase (isomerizing) [Candidatus Omnitrophota bacterium]
MCGIFGYVGEGASFSSLIGGLSKLEYRGYDSCGVAAIDNQKLFLKKRAGKIQKLKEGLGEKMNKKTSLCILHTRWATHGRPNKINAHPHLDSQRKVALVHNGIIENFLPLKNQLIKEGYKFLTETDTEVIVCLIEKFYKKSLEDAVLKAIAKLKGSFALGVISLDQPDRVIAVRKDSPLIIGLSKEGNFLASDVPALLSFTKKAIYLKDQELAILEKERVKVFNFQKKAVKVKVEEIKVKAEEAEKKGYEHFMLKEIFEQPAVLRKILFLYCKGKNVHFSSFKLRDEYLKKVKKIFITACGTAYHAGYVAKYFLEKYCGVVVEIDTSSEFRYRKIKLGKEDLLLAISQSGETADTLAAVREAKKCGVKVLSICNVVGSSLVKESDAIISTLAGPEIGVASTKAYIAQVFCLYLFSLHLAKLKNTIKDRKIQEILSGLKKTPHYLQEILNDSRKIKRTANKFSRFGSFLFLGRGINYPSALEGALKLKEISYIPAEGYPAGEMKHGPIALIDEYRAVVCIAPRDQLYEKMVANMQEVKARKGKILTILNNDDREASTLSRQILYMPKVTNQDLSPFLVAVNLQLFAYFVAKNRGCEIDQPRNLAKSVTVE